MARFTPIHPTTRHPLPRSQVVHDFTVHPRPTHGPNPHEGLFGRLAEQCPVTGYEPNPITALDVVPTNATSRRASLANITAKECSTNFPTTTQVNVNDDDLPEASLRRSAVDHSGRHGMLNPFTSEAILAQVAILLKVTLKQYQTWLLQARIFVTTSCFKSSFSSFSRNRPLNRCRFLALSHKIT